MENKHEQKLDNPAWYSLTETHAPYSVTYQNLKCYTPDFCSFGAFDSPGNSAEGLEEYAKLNRNFFIIGYKPQYGNKLTLKKELVCLQMMINSGIETAIKEEIVRLDRSHERALYELVNLVQPGYFGPKTMQLGDYYGIFKNEGLVAVTGERMKMTGYTEISAVVTHPGHTGKGLASQLLAHTVNKILSEGKTPYLHVTESNTNAIRLYEKAGFITRRKISFWNLIFQ